MGYRAPTFNDLYYLRMGNTNLRPERADQYNLGLTWTALSAKRSQDGSPPLWMATTIA